MMKPYLMLFALLIAAGALGACGAVQATPTPLLTGSNYTPLGGVQKSEQPTASDLAGLQAAENGALGEPALVEFFADY
jgi:hypothetical protein